MTAPMPELDIIRQTPPPAGTITLVDGTTHTLRYSMDSIAALEDRFGSMQGIMVEVAAAQAAMAAETAQRAEAAEHPGLAAQLPTKGARAPMMTIMSDAIAAGLRHVRVPDPDWDPAAYAGMVLQPGQIMPRPPMVRLGKSPELVREMLDGARLSEYMGAFAAAFGAAFGALLPPGVQDAPRAEGNAQLAPSPGGPGGTPPPSSAGGPPAGSGG